MILEKIEEFEVENADEDGVETNERKNSRENAGVNINANLGADYGKKNIIKFEENVHDAIE